MGKDYLVDSNVFRKYIDAELSEKGKLLVRELINLNKIKISVISRIELLSWNTEGFTKNLIEELINLSFEFQLSEPIIQKTIELRKTIKIKLPDAIIAATAMVNNLILLSDNDKDFGKIPALKYINPRKYK